MATWLQVAMLPVAMLSGTAAALAPAGLAAAGLAAASVATLAGCRSGGGAAAEASGDAGAGGEMPGRGARARGVGRAPVRFVGRDPVQPLGVVELSDEVEVRSWTFGPGGRGEAWDLEGVEEPPRWTGGSLLVRPSDRAARLRWDVDLEAAAIDAVVVPVAGVGMAPPRLRWRAPGGPFDETRQVAGVLVAGRVADGEWLFPVGRVEGWEGPIGELRLDPNPDSRRQATVGTARGVSLRADRERLLAAASRPWKIDRGNDRRNALITPPGTPAERELSVEAGARLRLAWGIVEGVTVGAEGGGTRGSDRGPGVSRGPVGLRVTVAASGADGEGTEGEPRAVLFEERAAGGAGPGWHPLDLDLGPWQGRVVRVTLESFAPDGRSPLGGIAAWAHPEVTSPSDPRPGPNVVVISIDTLRADRLSLNGYPLPTTPRIDAWAARVGVNFPVAVAAAPWTLASHASMLGGLDALRHGVHSPEQRPPPGLLAEHLRRAGYATVAVTGAGLMHPVHGFDRGFDRYVHHLDDGEIEAGTEVALRWMEELRDRPFHLFFHTYEVHDPYRERPAQRRRLGGPGLPDGFADLVVRPLPPDASTGPRVRRQLEMRPAPSGPGGPRPLSLEGDGALLSSLYDQGVAHADAHVGRLLERLADLGLERDTVVVLTSDHGEALGEHGLLGHGQLYDDNLLVPLVIAYPAHLEGGRRVDRQVRSIDILPTVLELAGLPVPGGLDGTSLVPLVGPGADGPSAPPSTGPAWSYAANTNFGVGLRLDGRWKYIASNVPWQPGPAPDELYDLGRDPLERDDRAALERERVTELRERVRRRLAGRRGLRVTVRAAGRDLGGRFTSPALTSRHVKAFDLPCDCVRWSRRAVHFEAPAGTTYSLVLDAVPGGPLTLELGAPGAPDSVATQAGASGTDRASLELDPATFEGPLALARGPGGWREVDPRAGEVEDGVTLAWQTGGRVAGEGLPAADPSLAERLEALGYVR